MRSTFYVMGVISLLASNALALIPANTKKRMYRQGKRRMQHISDASPRNDTDGSSGSESPSVDYTGPTLPASLTLDDDKSDDKDTVQLLIKYKNQKGRSNAARFGRNGKITVDVDRYNVASIQTERRNLKDLESDPNIEKIEVDQKMYMASLRGAQPRRATSHKTRRLAEAMPYGIHMVQADMVPMGPYKVKICVVDTGYGVGHPDLPTVADHGVDGWDDGSTSPWYVDKWAHGTHCAGTIGAIGSNDEGVVGVIDDPNAFSFFITKGLNQDDGTGSWSTIAASVQKCVEAGSRVISMSKIGGGGDILGGVLEEAYRDDGVLIVAAAGNWGTNKYSFPASYPSVMSVVAVDTQKNLWRDSQTNNQVEIAAPGKGVRSTITYDNGTHFSYETWEATSMATPHVAGVAAKLLSHFPHCANYQIRNALDIAARDRGEAGCDNYYGHGVVQALDAKILLDAYGCEAFGTSSDEGLGIGGCSQTSNLTRPPRPPTPPTRPGTAIYDEWYGTPCCLTPGFLCDTNTLLNGRGNMTAGAETNQPNTLDGCADGNSGIYLTNESIDNLVVRSTDSQVMQEGKPVEIKATVYIWGAGDFVDLFYASDANNPNWTKIDTFAATGTNGPEGFQVFTAQYILPVGPLQAVRANLRWKGNSPIDFCGGDDVHDNWGEADDMVFSVSPSTIDPTSTPSSFPSSAQSISPGSALYNENFGTPCCLTPWFVCDTNTLLNGRGNMTGGAEMHQPNTLDGCPDGHAGTYLTSESIEKLVVRSVDSHVMQEGKLVEIEATVHVWGVNAFIDTYYAANAEKPYWTKISTFSATGTKNSPRSIQVFTANYTLPTGTLHAVRANLRWQGASPIDFCGGDDVHDNWGEADDLVFAVYRSCDEECGEASVCVDGVCSSAWPSSLPSQNPSASPSRWPSLSPSNPPSVSARPSPVPSNMRPGTAVYNIQFGTPCCLTYGSLCDTNALLAGRGSMAGGAEMHQPNTLDGCSDGDSGVYLTNASIEKLVVRAMSSEVMQEGNDVEIEATVRVWGVGNYVDIYHAPDANNPNWTKIDTFAATCTSGPGEIQVFVAQYNLPAGPLQAVRANLRWQGAPPTDFCGGDDIYDNWGEADDLVFAVTSSCDGECSEGFLCIDGACVSKPPA